jgi:mycothiol synthase
MEYKHYRGGDEAAIVACWNRSMPRDQLTVRRFVETTLLDQNFDEEGMLEACDGDHLVGFVHAITTRCRQSNNVDGWICALAVDPTVRRQGIGRRLLALAEGYLAELGCRRVIVAAYPPNYYYPGVPVGRYPGNTEFFEVASYNPQITVVAMDRSLVNYEFPTELIPSQERLELADWCFRPISPPWYLRFIRLSESFSADWGDVARRALRAAPAPGQIQLATRGSELGGFAMFGAYDSHPERFGPFGVDPTLRTQGIGGVLLHRTMQEMAACGLHGCWFLWTGEHEPAGRLYHRAGFEVTRRFTIYERNLGPVAGS